MKNRTPKTSNAFQAFLKEAPCQAKAWSEMVQAMSEANPLDGKTAALAYVSVLAALRIESGIPFHVTMARELGCTREEIIGAVLLGLPAAGTVVIQSLPAALEAFDAS